MRRKTASGAGSASRKPFHLSADQIGRQRRQAIVLAFKVVVLDRHVLAFNVAGFIEAFTKRGRNGRLNQTAYSLFLFIRDVADGDLVGWIDAQLEAANSPPGPDRLARMRAALLEPMREIHGVSDKVLAMALSALLLGAPKKMVLWIEVGGSMIAIDTLVHNFLHRTGILARFSANHPYGAGCYRPGSCADIIQAVAGRIDARQFNPWYPKIFPRFVQYAIWRYCAQDGLDVCNGNRINDARRCENKECRVRLMCDRIALRP